MMTPIYCHRGLGWGRDTHCCNNASWMLKQRQHGYSLWNLYLHFYTMRYGRLLTWN